MRYAFSALVLMYASIGGDDLLRDPVLTIPLDGPSPPIEIEYTPGGGSLEVQIAKPIPLQGAVLLVPTFPASTGPVLQSTSRLSTGLPGRNILQFSNLAPGDYSVYGFSRFEDVEFRNPAFLGSLSGGTSVHVEDGKTAEVTITDIPK
jgi:hypothetical protein